MRTFIFIYLFFRGVRHASISRLTHILRNLVFSLLQVEHRTTEKLTEQIEKRVGSETNSLDEMSTGSSKESMKTEEKRNALNKPLTQTEQIMRVSLLMMRLLFRKIIGSFTSRSVNRIC